MNMDQHLKLQAYMDGELPAAEAKQVEASLSNDAESRALLGELKMTKAVLAGNELAPQLPEAREFYWGKIGREINRAEQPAPAIGWSWQANWLKWLLPATGALTALAVMMFATRETSPGLDETENALEETSIVSFRSPAEKMSVIWVQSDVNSDFTTPEPDSTIERNDNN
jgi:anti-sigma factor RsiW